MTIKVGNAEFTFDGYYNTSQTIHNLADKCYQQGKADAIDECIKIAMSVGTNEYSFYEMLRQIKQLKEQTE